MICGTPRLENSISFFVFFYNSKINFEAEKGENGVNTVLIPWQPCHYSKVPLNRPPSGANWLVYRERPEFDEIRWLRQEAKRVV